MLKPLQDAILQLFAILAAQGDKNTSQQARQFITTMLSEVLPKQNMDSALTVFDNYLALYAGKTGKKGLSAKSVRFLKKAGEISNKLSHEERHLLCIRSMEFVTQYARHKSENLDFVRLIADVFLINEQVYRNIHNVVSGNIPHSHSVQNIKLPGSLSVLFISENEIYVKTIQDHISEQPGLSDKLYFRLQYQQSIELADNKKLLYSDILRAFISRKTLPFKLHIKQLNYAIKKKHRFFHGLNLRLESPGLCAVVGPSGAGKSTLLKLIAGILQPKSGSITFSPSPPVMAFIPQEDSINPDLSVRHQLLAQAKKHSTPSPASMVEDILHKTGLTHKADSLPGVANHSMLSGGERKRLSIGCGIITQPDMLICDEPSSGLSFEDTNKIIRLLRNIANENCLIICSLHQPDASVIAYFDNMLYLDEQGHPVYFGSPEHFPHYVETMLHEASEPLTKQTEASQLAKAEARISEPLPDEFGLPTQKRKYPPAFWNSHFNALHQDTPDNTNSTPATKTKRPKYATTIVTEFAAFLNRKAYATIIMLYAPVMALIIAPLCRFSGTGDYTPLLNPHFPVFFIITVVIALFSGLIFSLGELSRKQSEHKRDWITGKSNKQVILSKLCVLLPAGLIQSLLFSLISLAILDIMYLFMPVAITYFLLYLFSASTGLMLSAVSNGKIWAYLLVPLLLIPQILFSGAMIPWDKFPEHNTKNKAPVISRFFAAAWAYESLITDALVLHPTSNYHNEKAYFISSYFLQDVLPFWDAYCDTATASDKQCIPMINQVLPQEIKKQVSYQDVVSIQEWNNKLHALFEASLSEQKHIVNNRYPLLWHQVQHVEAPPVEINHGKMKLNLYPLYNAGNLRSYKSAKLNILNKPVRHAYVSWAVIFLMGFIQYIFLFSKAIQWPWKTKS
ncbi:MAG: ATP-binding cassette domain-containing protein [Candidatus Delongbacteria bacterium]|jgi:ABC-type multidrug transport system ATPase subunit|nr:ATP-binding cassette domain-containing protein [Candidatus Delongbacteria bacterium]